VEDKQDKMRFDLMLIAFLMVTLFVIGGTMMIQDTNDNYGSMDVNISDDDFGEVYNKSKEIYEITKGAKEATLDGEIDSGSASWQSMTEGSYSAIRLVRNSFGLFTGITNAVASKLSIPEFITTIAFTAFSLIIIFGIVYMIFRYKN